MHLIYPRDLLRVLWILWEILRYKLGKVFVRMGLVRRSNPVRLRNLFERLGATFLKVGQILSMRPDFLPMEYCDELMKLLDRIPPFPTRVARDIIQQTLGGTPEELFASFNPAPLAAATFGQVYEARLRENDTRVVVKVQRPGMLEAVERDLRILYFFASLVDMLGVSATRMVPKVQEFARWTWEELDYRWEAKHMSSFRGNFRSVPTVRVPRVYWRYTGRRVLTMEFMEGVWLADVLRALNSGDTATLRELERLGYDGMAVSRNLHENFLDSAFRHGLFHADQHAANVLVQAGNRIGYVDFGIVGKWDQKTQQIAMRFLKAINDENVEEAFTVFSTQVATVSRRTRLGDFEREFKAAMQDWLFHVGFSESTPEQRSLARLLLRILAAVRRHKLELPLETLAYYRTIITLDSLYLRLAPRYNARRVGQEYFTRLMTEQALEGVASQRGSQQTLAEYLVLLQRLPRWLEQARQDSVRAQREVAERLGDLREGQRQLQGRVLLGGLGAVLVLLVHWPIRWAELSGQQQFLLALALALLTRATLGAFRAK